jgi:hypothetical protein
MVNGAIQGKNYQGKTKISFRLAIFSVLNNNTWINGGR